MMIPTADASNERAHKDLRKTNKAPIQLKFYFGQCVSRKFYFLYQNYRVLKVQKFGLSMYKISNTILGFLCHAWLPEINENVWNSLLFFSGGGGGREQGGFNLPLPVPFNPGSRNVA